MQAAKFVESYMEAWNHGDPENVRRTHDELIVSLNEFFADFPQRYALIGEFLTSKSGVAFTVGFNSNSAFYAAFKKHVGMTPAQFRRSRSKQPC